MNAVKKILLVDDDEDLREALADQLVLTEDFDVFEAEDGPPDEETRWRKLPVRPLNSIGSLPTIS